MTTREPAVRDWPAFAGTPDEVAAMVRAQRRDGVLLACTAPLPVPGQPDRVYVRVWLAERPVQTSRRVRVAPLVAGAIAALTAVGVAAWLAVTWLIAHVALVVAALTAVALLVYAAGRVGTRPGIHCPGCRHQ